MATHTVDEAAAAIRGGSGDPHAVYELLLALAGKYAEWLRDNDLDTIECPTLRLIDQAIDLIAERADIQSEVAA